MVADAFVYIEPALIVHPFPVGKHHFSVPIPVYSWCMLDVVEAPLLEFLYNLWMRLARILLRNVYMVMTWTPGVHPEDMPPLGFVVCQLVAHISVMLVYKNRHSSFVPLRITWKSTSGTLTTHGPWAQIVGMAIPRLALTVPWSEKLTESMLPVQTGTGFPEVGGHGAHVKPEGFTTYTAGLSRRMATVLVHLCLESTLATAATPFGLHPAFVILSDVFELNVMKVHIK